MNLNKKKLFTLNNNNIYSITLRNNNNYEITFYNYGGYIHNIKIPYKNFIDKSEDVILGYENFDDCIKAPGYFNSIIGRVGNRISNSKFKLNDTFYRLSNNAGNNHLHGGEEGFNKKIWKVDNIKESQSEITCELKYFSVDLEEGYPGNLDCKTTYTLNNKNEFIIKYFAVSDKDTLINITNHNYWNFHGHGKHYKNISDHTIAVYGNKICKSDDNSIPTGEMIEVKNTKFDLLNEKNITQEFLDLGGVDNNYEISYDFKLKKIAKVYSNFTKMGVTYFSNQPGIQFYTGNMMAESYEGKDNRKYGCQFGLCLEPQFFPDAINQKNFVSPVIKANEQYSSTIIMKLDNNF